MKLLLRAIYSPSEDLWCGFSGPPVLFPAVPRFRWVPAPPAQLPRGCPNFSRLRFPREFTQSSPHRAAPPPQLQPLPAAPGHPRAPHPEPRGGRSGAGRLGAAGPGRAGSPRSPRAGCAVWQLLCQSAWLHSRTPCASSIIPPPPPGVSASLRAGSAAATAAAAAAGRMRGRRGAGQRWAARRGAERDRLPPARPGCGQPRGRSPPRAGSAAMEPPAGFACVLLCCALCLPAAAPRRPGHRGRCAPGPAAVRRLRAARFALSPPEGAGQPARLKSRLRAPRFAAPPELLLRALLPGFQLRAAGEDGDRDRDGDANGDAERRRRHRAVPALPPLPDLHGAGLGPGVPGAGWNTWQLVYLLLLSPPRPPPPSWSPRAAAGTAAGCCPRRPRPQPAHPRRAAGISSDTQPYRLAVCTPGPSPDPPSAPETAPRPLSIAALPGSPSAPRGLGYGSRDSAAWPGARGPAGGRAGSGSCPLLWGAKASLNELCTLRAGEPSACTGQCPFALCKCLLC